jgi:hypothetical protein
MVVLAVLTVLAAGLGLVSSPAEAVTAPYCGLTWGSLAKHRGQGPAFPPSPLSAVRAGEHPCYDRLVLRLNGPAPSYNVQYGPVLSQGRGLPVALRGGASLDIVLAAPTYDLNGVPTYHPADPANLVNVNGFRSFRQVASGGSFEGDTTIGLGVRARLPFRVFALSGPGTHSRIVIDVAQRW